MVFQYELYIVFKYDPDCANKENLRRILASKLDALFSSNVNFRTPHPSYLQYTILKQMVGITITITVTIMLNELFTYHVRRWRGRRGAANDDNC